MLEGTIFRSVVAFGETNHEGSHLRLRAIADDFDHFDGGISFKG
jgi:hypothetical protein